MPTGSAVSGGVRLRNHLLWVGPLLCFAGAVSYFEVFAKFPTLRDFPWVNLPLLILGLGLSVLALWRALSKADVYRGKFLGSLGLLVSSAITGLFVWYIFSYSATMPNQSAAGRAQTHVPAFALSDHLGITVRDADLRGKKAVLVFFRGHW